MKIIDFTQTPDFFYYNNKKVAAFSYFNSKTPVPKIIAEKQLEVFKFFDLNINVYDANMRHPIFIDNILEKIESDIYIFFEIDSIPLRKDLYDDVLKIVDDNNIFGPAQQDNCNNLRHAYAGPACLCLTRNAFEKIKKPSAVERQRYLFNNKVLKSSDFCKQNGLNYKTKDEFYFQIYFHLTIIGATPLCDTAEEFTYAAEENSVKVNLWYPTGCHKEQWDLIGKYKFGNGTTYNDSIYHQFQIRDAEQIKDFVEKCDSVIKK